MADKKISQLTALAAANLAPSTDVLAIVDTSATETKKIVAQDLINGVLNVASAVGIGTASPASKLDTAGTIRATSQTVPSSGTGAELFYDATNAGLRGYNRTGSAYVNLALNDNVYIGGGSSGNVGIGTSSPAVKLHVQGSAGQIMRVTDGTTGASIYSGGGLFGFNNQTGEDGMFGSTASHFLYFATNGTERARFNSTGAFVLAGGTTTADGIGITFPATQSASTNANTLDDYEEGTWTPTDTSGAGLTFSINSAQYTKIGRAVTVNFEFSWPTTSNGNNASFSMPFTPLSTNRSGIASFSNVAGEVNVYVSGGLSFVLYDDTGGQITNATMSGKYVIASLVYYT